MSVSEVATQFVDLALEHKGNWGKITRLSVDKIQVFFATVEAAGFDPKEVKLGRLRGDYRDQDCSITGETYVINDLCPCKVIDQEGEDDYCATGWLDSALCRVVSERGWGPKESREQLIDAIATEIARSVPLKPVQLTPEGDLLREYPPSGGSYLTDHTRDDNRLGSCVGIHMYCDSWMDRHRATKTHDAISCRGCHLRVLFPKEIKTYGELRAHLASKFLSSGSTPVFQSEVDIHP